MPTTVRGPNILPLWYHYKNGDKDKVLTLVRGTFSWLTYTVIEVRIPGVGATLTLGDSDLEVLSATDLKIKLRTTDFSAQTAGTYRYQVWVGDGIITQPVPVGEGDFILLDAIT